MDGRIRMPALRTVVAVAAVLVSVAFAHGRAVSADFVAFDDDHYIYANPQVLNGLTRESVVWAFQLAHPRSYFHPVTWLSLMLDTTLFGTAPWGYHLVNVLLHAASAVLLLLVLVRTTRLLSPSLAAALLFAVHPLTVEAVAWAAERKAVLSTALGLAAVLVYTIHARRPSRRLIAAVAALLCAAVLAKPAAVVLPALLLVVDLWPLERLRGAVGEGGGAAEAWRAAKEKVPIAAAAVAAFVPALVSARLGAETGPPGVWPMSLRAANAIVSIPRYLGAAVWPAGLSVFRLFPEHVPAAATVLAALAVTSVTGVAIASARRAPFLTAGWAWFLVALAPYLGLMRTGLWPAWADRFAYLPLIGLTVAAAFGARAALGRVPHGRTVGVAIAAAAILSLAVAARAQTAHWQNSIALFRRGAAMEPGSFVMNFGLGGALADAGMVEEALPAFEAALRIYPTSAQAHAVYANALARRGRLGEAELHFQEALRLDPADPRPLFSYARLLEANGFTTGARALYDDFLRRAPETPELAPLRAEALRRLGR